MNLLFPDYTEFKTSKKQDFRWRFSVMWGVHQRHFRMCLRDHDCPLLGGRMGTQQQVVAVGAGPALPPTSGPAASRASRAPNRRPAFNSRKASWVAISREGTTV